MSDKDELAALRKRVEELEAKANPPEPKPFVEQPYQLKPLGSAATIASIADLGIDMRAVGS